MAIYSVNVQSRYKTAESVSGRSDTYWHHNKVALHVMLSVEV